MTNRFAAVAGLSTMLIGAALGFAGPAVADDSADAPAVESFSMPDVTGMTLAQALAAVSSAAEGTTTPIPTDSLDMKHWGRKQLAPPNWTVCATNPQAGAEFSSQTGVLLGVVRRFGESCG